MVKGKRTDPVKNMIILSLHDLHTTCQHLLDVSFATSLKSNLCEVLTTYILVGE